MIQNSSLKTAIVSKFSSNTSMTKYEIIATEIIFYKYLLSFISSNQNQYNNISTLVSSYASSFVNKFTELKNKYTSYLTIINFLKQISATNLLSMNEEDIDIVYDYYKNSKRILDFSITTFNPEIYSANSLTSQQYNYLRNIHFSVLCPIIKYYMKFYNLKERAMKIIDSNSLQYNIGKRIEFYIDGISSSTVYADITSKKFPIEYYKIDFKYPNLVIINK